MGAIFGLAAATGIIAFVAFGLVSPDTYLIDEEAGEAMEAVEPAPAPPPADAPRATVSILEGSAVVDAPDYAPEELDVERGTVIVWTNDDAVVHTVTSDGDFGDTFDSGLVSGGEAYELDTSALEPGAYDYICVVHPWMKASFSVTER